MDCWIQRIFAMGIVVIAVALIYNASIGNDGQVMAIISGIIGGLMLSLGISNTFLKPEVIIAK